MQNQKIKVTIAVDTSGSCTGDLPKFFAEFNSLMKSFGNYEVNLIQCDAEVTSCDKYDGSTPFDPDIKNFNFKGFGGTSFKPVFKYVREHGIEQDCLIYFTDGYGDAPDYPPPYPVLWVLTTDHDDDFCSWGTKLPFKEKYQRENY